MSKLFKDRVKEESYASLLELLRGDRAKCELELLGVMDPPAFHGKPERDACSGLGPEGNESDGKERRVCKCLYYYSKDPRNCERHPECDYLVRGGRCRIHEDSAYSIADYEIPPYVKKKVPGVGNVDLILKGPDGTFYATEVKPPEGNPESLLRMIAEIVTYTLCDFKYKGKTTRRAIAFFANSDQAREYDRDKNDEALKALLEEADISVFCFREIEGEKAYKICKL